MGVPLPVERHRYLLRHCLGIEGQRVFDNLPSSRAVAEPSPASTPAAATSGLFYNEWLPRGCRRPQRKLQRRHRFRRRYQEPGDSLPNYLTTLRYMAVPAKFGSQQDENIREQFTAGVLSTTIPERLLLDSTLPFEQKPPSRALRVSCPLTHHLRVTARQELLNITTSGRHCVQLYLQRPQNETCRRTSPRLPTTNGLLTQVAPPGRENVARLPPALPDLPTCLNE
ncbi:hypothetical protein HPB47_014462 [Ixodes persulcatus]|uniref:Uncharacterized protein n=1 Tax=Ixodes persulcatus TaxID=34615 RepID=A0AC60QW20_IXOPE|nr:hypothetical protein HPB47_014462 [Ixodes persulcatus]